MFTSIVITKTIDVNMSDVFVLPKGRTSQALGISFSSNDMNVQDVLGTNKGNVIVINNNIY